MCGYIGKISLNQIDTKSLNEANQIQVCRGPDETKSLNLEYKDRFNISLIFNRLSIIDLDIKASQPMYSKEHNSYILFNGEIFNYIEIKKDLYINLEIYNSADELQTEIINNHFNLREKFNKERRQSLKFCLYGTMDSIYSDLENLEEVIRGTEKERLIARLNATQKRLNDKLTVIMNLVTLSLGRELKYSITKNYNYNIY